MNSEKIEELKNKYTDTLKQTSIDKHDGIGTAEYMTESDLDVINFDSVKDEYAATLSLPESPKSNDALYIPSNIEDEWYFIEFKNGEIHQKKNYEIRLKIYDSLLILLDIIDENISFSRAKINYILVYNSKKKHGSCYFNKEVLEKTEVNGSPSKAYLVGRVSELANDDYVQFDLGRYKKIYFKDVHTYTEQQFERKFVSNF